ncbi:OLC1v1015476C1 [Oldenlandia corymbosa var. corymbosa]|uniref:OLC1v1015476C1 n=1 Tax=Oldenlandia corymbosa var. corymbosa TaxID=529605 RepID=A0AAV1E5Q1_OLDCO|nr:OLC1v1015476C1 [Oldenlandia corymbosa var. corymbosa]
MVFLEFEDPTLPQRAYDVDTSSSVKKLTLVASIAAAVQYGWALQLSLLTPYIQLLGVPHEWAAFVWLCGPISGLVVQPTIGHYSDNCTSRFGRRRPFLVIGAFLLCIAVLLIGFAADIGISLGDSLDNITKPRAVAFFVIGFWILDISNNMIQGPCRALLADLSANNDAKLMVANALFAFFMAVGNIIGYSLGSYMEFYKFFPFTKTEACDLYCANLKSCFFLSIIFVIGVMVLVVLLVKEEVISENVYQQASYYQEYQDNYYRNGYRDQDQLSFFGQLALALGNLSKPMRNLLIVTTLNWIGWFPFTMFSTDWMGKEVYGGQVNGTPEQISLYHMGVWAGTKGLILYVVSLGVVSLFLETWIRLLGNVKRVWGMCNFILAICMVMTIYISNMAFKARSNISNITGIKEIGPPMNVKVSAMALFTTLGIPQAATYSIPFALASVYSNESGTGQALGLGVVNLAIVIPQMFVAIVSGLLDESFDGSNLPAFSMGAVAAGLSGVFALVLLKA